jgi:hypothetical protein
MKFDVKFWDFSVPPEWVIEPKDTSVVAGQAVALHCQAGGFPLPTVIWRKGHGNYLHFLNCYFLNKLYLSTVK